MSRIIIAALHGDVFIEPVESADLTGMTQRVEPILAYGEVTGHCHRVTALKGTEVVVWEKDGFAAVLEVRGGDGAVVTHEEHNRLCLKPGTYTIGIQRESSPFASKHGDEWQPVRD